jgi:asparagine synthase (glutamine-hydrolysing)
MCGICGVLALEGPLSLPEEAPRRMIGVMRHRGPDEFGAWRDDSIFLGHARLSIIDLEGGQQPMPGPRGRHWISFNGEIFNYVELAAELEALGHVFRTSSDTEVILHAYQEWGEACVERFNGQFAFAIWDRHQRQLFLARDRFGIRPLFLTRHEGKLLFASEIKALAAFPGYSLQPDSGSMAEVFTYWVNIAPATAFAGVYQLPPGHTATIDGDSVDGAQEGWPGCLKLKRYWTPSFLPADEDRRFVSHNEAEKLAGQVREKLVDAAVIRLRADVPVGAYLSGGLDSSATAALIHHHTDHHLKTFSVGFEDPDFDETWWQHTMARHIGTEHVTVRVDSPDIARRFRQVVRHAETPILRTAPTPLHALSALARREQFKVVLTGEGADEVFVGYNIFREAKVRRFWSRQPDSQLRPLLLTRLYPYLAQSPPQFLRRFYGQGLTETGDAFYSHRPRWRNTGAVAGFLAAAEDNSHALAGAEERLAASLPAEFQTWGAVARAQYLEMTTFMAGYLLSSQGDRMLMGNSVEGRFPFLDHNLADFAGTLPASVKLRSLSEKALLKMSVAGMLPGNILSRPKQPYRAPDSASFRTEEGEALVQEFLTPEQGPGWELWDSNKVAALVRKWRSGRLTSARDNMAFVGF